jgi:hypothetical protein
MAKGDRVRITNGTIYEDNENALVFVYDVRLDADGRPVIAHDGTVSVNSLGGVKNNSTGVICGFPEKVHRSQLKSIGIEGVSLNQNDYAQVIPIMLDTYQKMGWFPIEHIRIVSGGVAQ